MSKIKNIIKKGILFTTLILILAYFVFAVNYVNIITPTSNQNLSEIITLNATTGVPSLNVTFMWKNSDNEFVLNSTIHNDSGIDIFFENASFDTTLLTDGYYNLIVNSTNISGSFIKNSSISSITIDNTAPAVYFVRSQNTHTLTPTITFNYTDSFSLVANCSIYISGTSYANNITTLNATNTIITLTSGGLIAGINNVLNITCRDRAGNLNSTITNINLTNHFLINGTTYDVNSNVLNSTNVTILTRNSAWSQVWKNSTTTDSSGYFAMFIPNNSSYMHQLSLIHKISNVVDYVGQSLPSLPYAEFSRLTSVNYYLKNAGTINISVVNSSNILALDNEFAVQIKDTKLGFEVSCNDPVSNDNESICYVPRDRNYSVMVYPSAGSPQNFVPVSFNWNNFSGSYDYNIGSLSNYNATKKQLNKQFNITQIQARITGNISFSGIGGWNQLTVVPFLLEPSDMIFMSYGTLPFNASAWWSESDHYNLTTGFYNISVPYSSDETVEYILFATARNESTFYGSYRNFTVNGDKEINFTMYGMLGNSSFINMSDSMGGSNHIANTSRHTFSLVNSTSSLSNVDASLEVTVDYSNYGAMEFTFLEDISGANDGTLSLPLLNVTGVKEINIYSQTYSPKRVGVKTASQLIDNSNISLSSFNPGEIPGESEIAGEDITIDIYKSNSTCNVPNPPTGCSLSSSTDLDSFNPISVVMGGGDISFRMGVNGVIVHYVNVDLLASGPPDAMFEENDGVTSSSSSAFDAALKFGSNGPTIYDYVLISIPYSEAAGSGLDDSNEVNISIPYFYDENWNVSWNISNNGTKGANLAGNDSHYSAHQTEWEILMNSTSCYATTTGTLEINTTTPCHIDTTNNKIWIRIPHFSGNSPSVLGSVVASSSTTTTTTTTSGSSGGGGSASTKISGKSAKVVWNSLKKGSVAKVPVSNGEIGITEVSFNSRRDLYGVWLEVEKKESLPNNIKQFKNKVYRYLEISKSLAFKEGDIVDPIIKFKVLSSWLDENELNKQGISLFRYVNEEWKELETIIDKEQGDYIHYNAKTPGFSYFIIGKSDKQIQVKEPETKEEKNLPVEKPKITKDVKEIKQPAKENKLLGIALLVVVILVIIGILIWLFLFKKK